MGELNCDYIRIMHHTINASHMIADVNYQLSTYGMNIASSFLLQMFDDIKKMKLEPQTRAKREKIKNYQRWSAGLLAHYMRVDGILGTLYGDRHYSE